MVCSYCYSCGKEFEMYQFDSHACNQYDFDSVENNNSAQESLVTENNEPFTETIEIDNDDVASNVEALREVKQANNITIQSIQSNFSQPSVVPLGIKEELDDHFKEHDSLANKSVQNNALPTKETGSVKDIETVNQNSIHDRVHGSILIKDLGEETTPKSVSASMTNQNAGSSATSVKVPQVVSQNMTKDLDQGSILNKEVKGTTPKSASPSMTIQNNEFPTTQTNLEESLLVSQKMTNNLDQRSIIKDSVTEKIPKSASPSRPNQNTNLVQSTSSLINCLEPNTSATNQVDIDSTNSIQSIESSSSQRSAAKLGNKDILSSLQKSKKSTKNSVVDDRSMSEDEASLSSDRTADQNTNSFQGTSLRAATFCEFCGLQLINPKCLKLHQLESHDKEHFFCYICGDFFPDTCELMFHHKIKHYESDVLKAEWDYFQSSKTTPENQYKYYCNQCGEGFNIIQRLFSHKKELINLDRHFLENGLKAIGIYANNKDKKNNEVENKKDKSKTLNNTVYGESSKEIQPPMPKLSSRSNENDTSNSSTTSKKDNIIDHKSHKYCDNQSTEPHKKSDVDAHRNLTDKPLKRDKSSMPPTVKDKKQKKNTSCSVSEVQVEAVKDESQQQKCQKIEKYQYRKDNSKEARKTKSDKNCDRDSRKLEKITSRHTAEREGKMEKHTSEQQKCQKKVDHKHREINRKDIVKTNKAKYSQYGECSYKNKSGDRKERRDMKTTSESEKEANTTIQDNKPNTKYTAQKSDTPGEQRAVKHGKDDVEQNKTTVSNSTNKNNIVVNLVDKGKNIGKETAQGSHNDVMPSDKHRMESNIKENVLQLSEFKPLKPLCVLLERENIEEMANKITKMSKDNVCMKTDERKLETRYDNITGNSARQKSTLPRTKEVSDNKEERGQECTKATHSKANSKDKKTSDAKKNVNKRNTDTVKGPLDLPKRIIKECDLFGANNPIAIQPKQSAKRNTVDNIKVSKINSEKSFSSNEGTATQPEKGLEHSKADGNVEVIKPQEVEQESKKRMSLQQYKQIRTIVPNEFLTTIPLIVPRPLISEQAMPQISEQAMQVINEVSQKIHNILQRTNDAQFSEDSESELESSSQETIPPIFCEACGSACQNMDHLTQHMAFMHPGFHFVCFVCDCNFITLDAMISHQVKYSKSILTIAESQFLRLRKPMPHMLYPYYCNHCGKGFTLIELISIHKKQEHDKTAERNKRVMKTKNVQESIEHNASADMIHLQNTHKDCGQTSLEVDGDRSNINNDINLIPNSSECLNSNNGQDEISNMLCEEAFNFFNRNACTASLEKTDDHSTRNNESQTADHDSPNDIQPRSVNNSPSDIADTHEDCLNLYFPRFCEACGQKHLSFADQQKDIHMEKFKCVICRSPYKTLDLLVMHYELRHPKYEVANFEYTQQSIQKACCYFCKYCGKGFHFIGELLGHRECDHLELLQKEKKNRLFIDGNDKAKAGNNHSVVKNISNSDGLQGSTTTLLALTDSNNTTTILNEDTVDKPNTSINEAAISNTNKPVTEKMLNQQNGLLCQNNQNNECPEKMQTLPNKTLYSCTEGFPTSNIRDNEENDKEIDEIDVISLSDTDSNIDSLDLETISSPKQPDANSSNFVDLETFIKEKQVQRQQETMKNNTEKAAKSKTIDSIRTDKWDELAKQLADEVSLMAEQNFFENSQEEIIPKQLVQVNDAKGNESLVEKESISESCHTENVLRQATNKVTLAPETKLLEINYKENVMNEPNNQEVSLEQEERPLESGPEKIAPKPFVNKITLVPLEKLLESCRTTIPAKDVSGLMSKDNLLENCHENVVEILTPTPDRKKKKPNLKENTTQGLTPSFCEACGMQFSNKTSVHKHFLSTHHAFSCSVCRREFTCLADLIKHQRADHLVSTLHIAEGAFLRVLRSKEKPAYFRFYCSRCGEGFNVSYHLMSHQDNCSPSTTSTLTNKRSTPACYNCGKTFLYWHLVNEHRALGCTNKIVAKDTSTQLSYQKNNDPKGASASKTASQQSKSRAYICRLCGKSFDYSFDLEKHVNSKQCSAFKPTLRPIQLTSPPTAAVSTSKKSVNSSTKPPTEAFKCLLCPNRCFVSEESLNQHLKFSQKHMKGFSGKNKEPHGSSFPLSSENVNLPITYLISEETVSPKESQSVSSSGPKSSMHGQSQDLCITSLRTQSRSPPRNRKRTRSADKRRESINMAVGLQKVNNSEKKTKKRKRSRSNEREIKKPKDDYGQVKPGLCQEEIDSKALRKLEKSRRRRRNIRRKNKEYNNKIKKGAGTDEAKNNDKDNLEGIYTLQELERLSGNNERYETENKEETELLQNTLKYSCCKCHAGYDNLLSLTEHIVKRCVEKTPAKKDLSRNVTLLEEQELKGRRRVFKDSLIISSTQPLERDRENRILVAKDTEKDTKTVNNNTSLCQSKKVNETKCTKDLNKVKAYKESSCVNNTTTKFKLVEEVDDKIECNKNIEERRTGDIERFETKKEDTTEVFNNEITEQLNDEPTRSHSTISAKAIDKEGSQETKVTSDLDVTNKNNDENNETKCVIENITNAEHKTFDCSVPIKQKLCTFCHKHFLFNFQLKKHKSKNCKPFLILKKKYKRNFWLKNICENCGLKFKNSIALSTHRALCCAVSHRQKKTFLLKSRKKSQGKEGKRKRDGMPYRGCESSVIDAKGIFQKTASNGCSVGYNNKFNAKNIENSRPQTSLKYIKTDKSKVDDIPKSFNDNLTFKNDNSMQSENLKASKNKSHFDTSQKNNILENDTNCKKELNKDPIETTSARDGKMDCADKIIPLKPKLANTFDLSGTKTFKNLQKISSINKNANLKVPSDSSSNLKKKNIDKTLNMDSTAAKINNNKPAPYLENTKKEQEKGATCNLKSQKSTSAGATPDSCYISLTCDICYFRFDNLNALNRHKTLYCKRFYTTSKTPKGNFEPEKHQSFSQSSTCNKNSKNIKNSLKLNKHDAQSSANRSVQQEQVFKEIATKVSTVINTKENTGFLSKTICDHIFHSKDGVVFYNKNCCVNEKIKPKNQTKVSSSNVIDDFSSIYINKKKQVTLITESQKRMDLTNPITKEERSSCQMKHITSDLMQINAKKNPENVCSVVCNQCNSNFQYKTDLATHKVKFCKKNIFKKTQIRTENAQYTDDLVTKVLSPKLPDVQENDNENVKAANSFKGNATIRINDQPNREVKNSDELNNSELATTPVAENKQNTLQTERETQTKVETKEDENTKNKLFIEDLVCYQCGSKFYYNFALRRHQMLYCRVFNKLTKGTENSNTGINIKSGNINDKILDKKDVYSEKLSSIENPLNTPKETVTKTCIVKDDAKEINHQLCVVHKDESNNDKDAQKNTTNLIKGEIDKATTKEFREHQTITDDAPQTTSGKANTKEILSESRQEEAKKVLDKDLDQLKVQRIPEQPINKVDLNIEDNKSDIVKEYPTKENSLKSRYVDEGVCTLSTKSENDMFKNDNFNENTIKEETAIVPIGTKNQHLRDSPKLDVKTLSSAEISENVNNNKDDTNTRAITSSEQPTTSENMVNNITGGTSYPYNDGTDKKIQKSKVQSNITNLEMDQEAPNETCLIEFKKTKKQSDKIVSSLTNASDDTNKNSITPPLKNDTSTGENDLKPQGPANKEPCDNQDLSVKKSAKQPVMAPNSEPGENSNTCHVCGYQFEYLFALKRHTSLYCKVFNTPTNNALEVSDSKIKFDEKLLVTKDGNKTKISLSSEEENVSDLRKHEGSLKKVLNCPLEGKEHYLFENAEELDEKFGCVQTAQKHELMFDLRDRLKNKSDLRKKIGSKKQEKEEDLTKNVITDYKNIIVTIKGKSGHEMPNAASSKEMICSKILPSKIVVQKQMPNAASSKRTTCSKILPSKIVVRNQMPNAASSKEITCSKILPSKIVVQNQITSKHDSTIHINEKKKKYTTYENKTSTSSSRIPEIKLKESNKKPSSSNKAALKTTASINKHKCTSTIHPTATRIYNKVATFNLKKELKIFCEKCGKMICNVNDLENPPCGHREISFSCPVCGIKFPNINLLILHLDERHEASEVFIKEAEDKKTNLIYCCHCGEGFKFLTYLINHKVNQHQFYQKSNTDLPAPIIKPNEQEESVYVCVFCNDKTFSLLELLLKHEKNSEDHKRNVRKFPNIRPNHSPILTKSCEHVCYICNIGFRSFKNQQIHMLTSYKHYDLEKKIANYGSYSENAASSSEQIKGIQMNLGSEIVSEQQYISYPPQFVEPLASTSYFPVHASLPSQQYPLHYPEAVVNPPYHYFTQDQNYCFYNEPLQKPVFYLTPQNRYPSSQTYQPVFLEKVSEELASRSGTDQYYSTGAPIHLPIVPPKKPASKPTSKPSKTYTPPIFIERSDLYKKIAGVLNPDLQLSNSFTSSTPLSQEFSQSTAYTSTVPLQRSASNTMFSIGATEPTVQPLPTRTSLSNIPSSIDVEPTMQSTAAAEASISSKASSMVAQPSTRISPLATPVSIISSFLSEDELALSKNVTSASSPNYEVSHTIPLVPSSDPIVASDDPVELEKPFIRYFDIQKHAVLSYNEFEAKRRRKFVKVKKELVEEKSDIFVDTVVSSDDEVQFIEEHKCYVCGESFSKQEELEEHECSGPF